MPLDVNVFDKIRSFADYQRAEDEFQLRKQAAEAQILTAQAALRKAGEVDADKLGETAFLKAAQGMELTPQETAALKYIDAKQPTNVFNPVTGVMETKPSLLDRAGLQGGVTPPRATPTAPPPTVPQPPKPAQFRYSDFSPENPPPASINEPAPSQPVQLTGDNGQPIQDSPTPTEVTANAAMEKELAAARGNPKLQQSIREKYAGSKTPDKIFSGENTLRDEFNTITKDFRSVQDAWNKIQTVSDTPAGDLSLIYSTAKLNDPGSVVREADFILQAKAGNFGDRIQNMVNGVLTGNRLTPTQKQNLIAEAGLQYKAQKQSNDKVIANYKGIAERNGFNVKNVIPDYSQPDVAYKPPQTTQAPQAPKTAPRKGEIRSGVDGNYLFNGGDPADRNNWKKVK